MDKLNRINLALEEEHPPSEMLLQLVDGELAAPVAARIQAHLEACWRCRVRVKKIEEVIEEIVGFDDEALKPILLPPNQWRGFDRRLGRLAAERGRRSMLARIKELWGRREFFRSPARPLTARWPLVKGAVVVAVVVAALAFGGRFIREPRVSASELLRNAAEARLESIRRTDHPVIHQRLRVRHMRAAGGAASVDAGDSLDWEVWEDALRARFRQSVGSGVARQFLPPSITNQFNAAAEAAAPAGAGTGSLQILADLAQVLRDNRMDPWRPLSPQSFGKWRDSLAFKRETVTQDSSNRGAEDLILRTVQEGPVEAGRIAEAAMTVRDRDRHTIGLRLRVRTPGADGGEMSEYDVVETAFEVVSLATLGPEIFEDRAAASTEPAAPPAAPPVAGPSPAEPAASPLPSPEAKTAAVAAAVEVEALRLLNEIGADLGEQLSVKRDAQTRLRIEGIVETAERKSQILQALAPVVASRAADVEIQTVAEAVAARKRPGAAPAAPEGLSVIEAPSGSVAAEAELQSYFHENREALQFAARAVSRSQEAMRRLYALRRLSARFSAEELQSFDPETREKWLTLIRSHARAYRQELVGLRRDLRPIFFPGAVDPPAAEEIGVADLRELARMIETLFALGEGVDRQVLAAFTASSEGAAAGGVKSPQFWQSLLTAEALSARIQSTP
jgi:anti-sigma factor RsiW